MPQYALTKHQMKKGTRLVGANLQSPKHATLSTCSVVMSQYISFLIALNAYHKAWL